MAGSGRCAVCMQPLPLDTRLVTQISAGGRPLFRVHSGNCAATAVSTARTAGLFALHAGRRYLAQRAPALSALLEDFAAFRRHQRLQGNASHGR